MERKYPRVACDKVVELELRHQGRNGQFARVVLPARMRSLAPEGLGFELEAPWGLLLRRDDTVVSRFALGESLMEIPGHVVWCASGRAGVALHLAAMPDDVRQLFSDWAIGAVAAEQTPRH